MYRTYEPARDRLVAVKAFRLDLTPEQARALADELQRLADAELDHPSIVRPIAGGVEGTLAYGASEYVAAESLDIALRHYAPAAIDKVLPFITQLAGALDFAQTAGIAHGALHPRDVFVTPDEARATGFGIVQALEAIGQRAPIRRPYTAPERVDGRRWDVRADVYSLGAIAFELLTGRRPVGAEVGPLGPGAGPHADAIATALSRALAESPDGRFPSALAFAAALEAASRGERTTSAVEAVRAVAETPVAPALAYEYDEAVEPRDDRRDEPTFAVERDEEAELDADMAEIQLREEEAARPADIVIPAPEKPFPHQLDEEPLARETETRREEPSLFEFEAQRRTEPAQRFDASEFAQLDTSREPYETPIVPAPEREEEREPVIRAGNEPPGVAAAPVEPLEPPQVEPVTRIESEPFERVEPVPVPRRRKSPRPVLLPVALTLLLGLFVGFLAGYLVGARDRGAAVESDATSAAVDAAPPRPSNEPARPPAAAPDRGATPPSPAAARRPAPPAPVRTAEGRLVVRSTPPGAQVYVNGRRRGTTPLSLRNLAAGTYTLRLTRSGFQDATQRVSIGASAVRDVSIRLTRPQARPAAPAPAPASTGFLGSLYVDSRPRGARVLLDGREVGTTPVQVADVRAGAHVVRMELRNHRPWTASTRVVAGQTVRVTGSLEPEP